MKAIIIAGGLGTRLRPLTYNRPKPIVSLANKPFILYQIELLKKYGIKDIILNLHYLSSSIELLLGKGESLGVNLRYSMEEIPLGTAGAVKNAEKFFDDEPIIVFNGDILTDVNLSELVKFHKSKNAKVTLTLTKVPDPSAYGLVLTDRDGRVNSFVEKPVWGTASGNNINAGIYIIEPEVFSGVPKGKTYSFERQLFPGLLEAGERMFAKVTDAYWMDIGSPAKYLQAHRDILNEEVSVALDAKQKEKGIWIGGSSTVNQHAKLHGPLLVGRHVNIHSGATINAYSVIGDSVRVSEGAMIEGSVVHRNSLIGRDVRLKDCIIGENCIIEDYAEIGTGVVLADYSIIKKGSRLE